MFNQLKDAIHWIETRIKFRPKTDLVRMRQAYEMLDIDLSHIKKIHIAGTNGKGSVASFITHILLEAGYQVGTFTSPYLISFNERIRYNFNNILDDELLDLMNRMYAFNETYEKKYLEPLAFFELLTLMSFIYFDEKKVDVMVMEVGLGGLLDATNILNYDVSLITSIGFDHMKQLGNTLESIAYNKLGILKPGNHLISTVDASLHPQFIHHASSIGASYELYTLGDVEVISYDPILFSLHGTTYELGVKGTYQVLNATLSIQAIHYLFKDINAQTIQRGLKNMRWAGRLEEIEPNIYLDGAHNSHALIALKETVEKTFKDQKIYVLFSALGDKDIPEMLKIIKSFAHQVILTSFPDSRFLDLSDLKSSDDLYILDTKTALAHIKSMLSPNDILICTGSLHLIGYLKSHWKVLTH